jgi:hypothetical protein
MKLLNKFLKKYYSDEQSVIDKLKELEIYDELLVEFNFFKANQDEIPLSIEQFEFEVKRKFENNYPDEMAQIKRIIDNNDNS